MTQIEDEEKLLEDTHGYKYIFHEKDDLIIEEVKVIE